LKQELEKKNKEIIDLKSRIIQITSPDNDSYNFTNLGISFNTNFKFGGVFSTSILLVCVVFCIWGLYNDSPKTTNSTNNYLRNTNSNSKGRRVVTTNENYINMSLSYQDYISFTKNLLIDNQFNNNKNIQRKIYKDFYNNTLISNKNNTFSSNTTDETISKLRNITDNNDSNKKQFH